MLDSLLAPLGLPSRVVRDLDAVGDAARGMPEFERALIERLDDIGAGTDSMSGPSCADR